MMNREGEGEGSGAPSSGRLSACTMDVGVAAEVRVEAVAAGVGPEP